jgi:5-methylcytosine-specific restriction endonuclease McrA
MSTVAVHPSLNASVLVLNRFYMAVHVVNVRRALSMLFRDLAEVVHLEDGQYANYDFVSWREISQLRRELDEEIDEEELRCDWIRAVNFDIQTPRIVRLLRYGKVPKMTVRFNRRNIFARDRNHCQYCGKTFPTSELSLDHVVPRSQGGGSTWGNIVCSCVRCNSKKGGRTPEQAHMRLICKPVKPKHSPLLAMKLGNPRYESWKTFVSDAYWNVDLV